MGNDGGSIPKRVDLVREKRKEIRRDTLTINQNRSMHCAISNERFTPPIMVCRLGYLYNKEVLLKCLYEKTVPKLFGHIRKLKDLKQVRVETSQDPASPYPLICPLSKLEFNGIEKFVVIWSCGCMISEKTLECKVCPLCSQKYDEADLIRLNASPEEIESRKQMLEAQRPIPKLIPTANNPDAEAEATKDKKVPDMDATKPEMLGKKDQRDLESYLVGPSSNDPAPLKKLKTATLSAGFGVTGNVLDKLAAKPAQSQIYHGLFHNETEKLDAKKMFFKDVRFGLR